ncbi:MAG: ATP-binding protein [Spirochaetales bacterium]|jgi:predicted AAA+ superfamily ATPase|nr:ATP-binding protein [Spirochaetales bacterium]
MYRTRTLVKTLIRASKNFRAVLVTGMRQVGKTTFLEKSSEAKRAYVTLDNPLDVTLAKEEPEFFFETHPAPVLIDEVQYAPELFRYVKMLVDTSKKKGLVWMTGSQQYNLMAGLTESLAGRVAVLDLLGFSLYEREGKGAMHKPFLPPNRPAGVLKKRSLAATYKIIWEGSYPEVAGSSREEWFLFYDSYLRTYLERDIRQLINIENEAAFLKFLSCAAARTAQELNLTDMARDAGIAPNTAKAWLSLLETSGIVYLLRPYHRNITKRLTKRPKLYFMDTGLCAYLTRWTSPETLEAGAMSGAFFETFVVQEILKSYCHNGRRPALYYYRDSNKVEIDLLLEEDGVFYPVEIKKTSNPAKSDIKAFKAFAAFEKTGCGSLICLTDKARPLEAGVNAISLWDM